MASTVAGSVARQHLLRPTFVSQYQALDIVVVEQIVAVQHMRQAQRQGRIRTHSNGDEPVSPARRAGAPDIDHHQSGTFASGHIDEGNLMHIGAVQIGPPGDDVVRILHALRLRPPCCADRQLPGFPTARVAHGASIHPCRPQGMKQRLGEIAIHQALMRAIGIAGDGFTAIAGDNRLPTADDLIQGLVPRDRGKLSLTLSANASQWGEQTLRRMHALGVTVHLAAEKAAREGMLRVPYRVRTTCPDSTVTSTEHASGQSCAHTVRSTLLSVVAATMALPPLYLGRGTSATQR